MSIEVIERNCKSLDDFLEQVSIKSYTESGEFDIFLEEKYRGTNYIGETQYMYDVRHKFVNKFIGKQANIVVYDVKGIALDSKGEISDWLNQELEYMKKKLESKKIRTEIQGSILKVYSAKDDLRKKLEQQEI